ncbi:hypothetical protein F4779DRAFT_165915 [Xylariaceae sp. FL0662B]|nr:hypothetical protein F4779DRAFT_165915 [Xylariaceae sp. FL0662B]
MAATDDLTYTTGAVLSVHHDSEGQYTVNQLEGQPRIPNVGFGPDSIIPIVFHYGPISISGQIDTSTLSIQVSVSVFGINIGSFSGNLKDGVCINVNIIAAKGRVCIQLRNGNEVWLTWDLKPLWGSEIKGEKLILKLPI